MLERLERLVLDDPGAWRFDVEYLHQHACLHWSSGEPELLADPSAVVASIPVVAPNGALRASTGLWQRAGRRLGLTAAAVLVLAAGVTLARPRAVQGPPSVATLVGGKACKWAGGTLPTAPGARLAAGRLRLEEGLVRIDFDCGAEVTLEAPAELEIVSHRRCVLHDGQLVAKVPPRASGFTVDTPTAGVEDLGTEFGVSVKNGRSADVQVFEGRLDVHHHGTGMTQSMRTGANLRFGPEGFAPFDPLAEQPTSNRAPSRPAGAASRLIQISTATGRGKDTYICPPRALEKRSPDDALLLVKNSTAVNSDWYRKAYLGLDLTPVAGMHLEEATLSFTFAPTGLGFASEVPDATFAVYGLTDESGDDWDERAVRWHDAPANLAGGAELDPAKATLLGRFEIGQGELTGTRSISGKALTDFLERDSNGLATVIVVRETMGSGRSDLVHGFAGRRHRELPPPTLKLWATPVSR